ncbi:aminopeptidase N [Paraburkholderia sediminicola]|uniref:aminopeptidase N n=1 Tax=Paraburkholderia sediminicola TaxID=458836 RepID=UPI0038BC48CF
MPNSKTDAVACPITCREDYSPPAFLVSHVDLEFDLDDKFTFVRTRLSIVRNPAAVRENDIKLDGVGLELKSLFVDGNAWTDIEPLENGLIIRNVPDTFHLAIESVCNPANNTSLMGLYASGGGLFTQCEPEGFRRITYFPDRPDVMASYRVTLRADKQKYPVLLSNGNLVESGDLADGRHFTKWNDPFRKPGHLFALVAANLVCNETSLRSASGKEKLLQVWVAPQDLGRTDHAMASLRRAIRWDESRYGLELDLDRYMMVAVNDFTMGGMENKGLNIFNTQYVLADSETATDADFINVETVVGHEYFHNWTGNRIGCRDWFQLSLKEGLTVFRDQEFSADMAAERGGSSAAAVRRIADVRTLRQTQFPEDAGPMAHPVRPESYADISNFYTKTVYNKGAEVVRMYQTLLGCDGFRRGMDLYVQRHDGQAATCDDFLSAMADANDADLSQFARWYSTEGTPRIDVISSFDSDAGTYALTFSQHIGKTARVSDDTRDLGPLMIPVRLGLLAGDGRELDTQALSSASRGAVADLVVMTQKTQTFVFEGLDAEPIPSLLRGFSAPVVLNFPYSDSQLSLLAAHDSDPFSRWDAIQRLATRYLIWSAEAAKDGRASGTPQPLLHALGAVLADNSLALAYREQLMALPSDAVVAEQMGEIDPLAIQAAFTFVRKEIGKAHGKQLLQIYEECRAAVLSNDLHERAGQRALRNFTLTSLAWSDPDTAVEFALRQASKARDMTDRVGALTTLITATNVSGKLAHEESTDSALMAFYAHYQGNELAIDKWFALQAIRSGSERRDGLADVMRLCSHEGFRLENPNRARALFVTLCVRNPLLFHRRDGAGYRFIAQQVISLDAINPVVAANLTRTLERWKSYAQPYSGLMRSALETIATGAGSKPVLEIVGKALG